VAARAEQEEEQQEQEEETDEQRINATLRLKAGNSVLMLVSLFHFTAHLTSLSSPFKSSQEVNRSIEPLQK